MSRGGHTDWWKVGGLGILLFLALYGLAALESGAINKRNERRTTYSTAAGGYKALYLWLDELSLPVKRWERTLNDLPAKASVLVLAEPELSPTRGELRSLREWIANGGTFVLIARQPNLFWSDLGLELEPVFVMQHLQDKKDGSNQDHTLKGLEPLTTITMLV
ncbi:MAG: DUF4350 domain-containing protein [Deltaproteobacteria bacterium]